MKMVAGRLHEKGISSTSSTSAFLACLAKGLPIEIEQADTWEGSQRKYYIASCARRLTA
jgi:hypothetical protein